MGEVSLEDYYKLAIKWERGYAKIIACCAEVREENIPYVWIDTYCIDKKSNADLSEAIISVHQWYARSKMCYAYLHDILSRDNIVTSD